MDIILTADKGGVGKSLMAAHIAGRLYQLRQDVLLVDLDPRLESSHHLSYAIPNLPTVQVGTDEVSAAGLRIWDCPAHPSPEMRLGMVGGLAVIVTDTGVGGLRAACDLYANLSAVGATARVLINDFPPTGGVGQFEAFFADASVPCFHTVVRRYACYQRAHLDGRLVCDYPYSKADEAWSDIKNVCDEILEMIDGA